VPVLPSILTCHLHYRGASRRMSLARPTPPHSPRGAPSRAGQSQLLATSTRQERAATRWSKAPKKLRKIVNAVVFCREVSERGKFSGGIRKSARKSGSSQRSFGVRGGDGDVEMGPAEPDAVSEIPVGWGGVEVLLEHFASEQGMFYLARFQGMTTRSEWVTEGPLLSRHDGRVALSLYHEVTDYSTVSRLRRRFSRNSAGIPVFYPCGV
jgi:hypothetical protein